MAEITLTLLTPISIRLSWTGGNGDYEVWWKSDHPAGQDYVPLASVSGTTYDVGSLSWTTTYYFKVRPVGGAFGSEIHVFICCGQAVLLPGYGNPSAGPSIVLQTSFYQQSSDPDDGEIAFTTKDLSHSNIYLYLYEDEEWHYKGSAAYTGQLFPTAVRKVGDYIAIFDIKREGVYSQTYMFSLCRGGQIPVPITSTEMWFGIGEWYSNEIASKNLPYTMEFNSTGRVVVASAYVDWDDSANGWPMKWSIRE
jgi:hypothetical protein